MPKPRPEQKLNRSLKKQLAAAIDHGLAPLIEAVTPRRYVELMTTSSAVIGRELNRAIQDQQFEQGRRAKSKAQP
jgi:hypothetical protein